MYKLTIQQERHRTTTQGAQLPEKEWNVLTEIVSDDGKVIAGALRAQADKLDPPKAGY